MVPQRYKYLLVCFFMMEKTLALHGVNRAIKIVA